MTMTTHHFVTALNADGFVETRCFVCSVPERIANSRSVTSHRRCNVVVCTLPTEPEVRMT